MQYIQEENFDCRSVEILIFDEADRRKKINQWYYHADSYDHKVKLLARFIETEKVNRGIIFVRRQENARELSETLRKCGIRSTYLEGEMAQTQRNNAIDKLK